MDQARAERAAKPDLGSAAEPLAHRSGSPAGAKRANARQRNLAISRPDCPLRHRTGAPHDGTFLPRGAVHRHSLGLHASRLPCAAPPGLLARARPRHREVRAAHFARLRSVLASPHLAGSVRQHRRPLGGGMEPAPRKASGMTAGARKTPGARQAPPGRQAPRQSPSRCANHSGRIPGVQETEVLRHGRCPPYSRKLPICRPRSSASCESA